VAIRFGMLGTIKAWWDGVPMDLGHARQRRVLGALLADPGLVVPKSRWRRWAVTARAGSAGTSATTSENPAPREERHPPVTLDGRFCPGSLWPAWSPEPHAGVATPP
jgi:hypothetical protein